MKIRNLIFCLICLHCLCGCGGTSTKGDQDFSIQGQVAGLGGKVLHLERITPSKAEPLQDITLDADGRFQLTQASELGTLFQLRADDGQRMLLFPENDALEIEADADEIEAFQVTGGSKTKMLRDFNLQQYRLYIDYVSAETQLDGLDRAKDTTAWHELEGVTDRAMVAYSGYLRKFCDTVKLPIMRAHASMSIAPMGNYYYLTQLSKRVSSELPSSTYAGAIDAALMKEAEGRVGVVASGLTGTDLDGKPFDLMALRGKPVMLMFWASYCEFSRMEFAKLKEMQQVFADAGRTLVCFSIDDHDADWRNFLKTAGLDWATHLRGMNGQQSAEIKQFKVKAIPSTYMINADGVIETIDVRADELAGYFGNPKAPQPIAVPE